MHEKESGEPKEDFERPPPHRRLRQAEEEDDPKSDMQLLVSGNGLDQLMTSFRGLVSEGRGSETIKFGAFDKHVAESGR